MAVALLTSYSHLFFLQSSTNTGKPKLQFLFLFPSILYAGNISGRRMKTMPTIAQRKPLERITTHSQLNHSVLDAKIKEARFTNAMVAEALGITEEYVRKLRKMDSNTHIKLLSRLMILFDLSYHELTIAYVEEPDAE